MKTGKYAIALFGTSIVLAICWLIYTCGKLHNKVAILEGDKIALEALRELEAARVRNDYIIFLNRVRPYVVHPGAGAEIDRQIKRDRVRVQAVLDRFPALPGENLTVF